MTIRRKTTTPKSNVDSLISSTRFFLRVVILLVCSMKLFHWVFAILGDQNFSETGENFEMDEKTLFSA